VNTDKMREEFEAWAVCAEHLVFVLERAVQGEGYDDRETDIAWSAWQAALSFAAAEPVAEVRTMMAGGNAGIATRIVALSDDLRAGDKLYTTPQRPADAEPVAEFGDTFIFNLRKQPNGERWPIGTKLYVHPAAAQARPDAPALDVLIDDEAGRFLLSCLSPDPETGECTPLRLILGDGHSGHGLYVSEAECPEEGASLLARIPTQARPDAAVDPDTHRVQEEADLLRAIAVMEDTLTAIEDGEDQELARTIESSLVDLRALVEAIRALVEAIRMQADPNYVPGDVFDRAAMASDAGERT
jgi:hypothetical protein